MIFPPKSVLRIVLVPAICGALSSCTTPSFEASLNGPNDYGAVGGKIISINGGSKFARIERGNDESFSPRSEGWLYTTAELGGATPNEDPGLRIAFGPNQINGPRSWIITDETDYIKLRGAIDFFFRIHNSLSMPSELRIFDYGNSHTNRGGLRLVLNNPSVSKSELAVAIINENASATAYHKALRIKPHQVYHVAITLTPVSASETQINLFAREGTGAISSNRTPDASATIEIKKEWIDLNRVFGDPMLFGIRNPRRARSNIQEFDRLRVYGTIPGRFSRL